MSELLYGYDLKYVEESGEADMAAVKTALDGASVKEVHEEGVSVSVEPHILDVIKSNSQEPYDKIDMGAQIQMNTTLVSSTLDDLKAQLNNDSSNSEAIVEATRVHELPKYHLQCKVQRSDGTVQTWAVSYSFLAGDFDEEFTNGDATFLPISSTSSSESQLDVTEA